jgi:uncharacterized membrane protein YgcG
MEFLRRSQFAISFLLCLLLTHTVYGTEVQIAAAIGEAYLPTPEPRSLRKTPATTFEQRPAAELPALGTPESKDKGNVDPWTRALIGAALLAAIVIIGNKGGVEGAPVPVAGTGGDGSPNGGGGGAGGDSDSGSSGSGSGNTSSSGGGGITLPPILTGGNEGNGNRNRNRSRDRDRD